MFKSTKQYGHEQGLSCCFRQHAASHSHCRLLHGYSIAVKLVFASPTLDGRNWVMDFGGLKDVKAFLVATFDHKLLVAADDPQKDELCGLAGLGLADVIVVDAVGCEAFAKLIYDNVSVMINGGMAKLESVEVKEHAGNSAIYSPQLDWSIPNPPRINLEAAK